MHQNIADCAMACNQNDFGGKVPALVHLLVQPLPELFQCFPV